MNSRKLSSIGLLFVFWLPLLSYAGSFDGSRSLKGSVDKIVEINQFAIKDDVDPDTIGLPERFIVDFKNNVVRPSEDSVVRKTIKIGVIEHVENKLVLQGVDEGVENVDDGLAWSLVISKKNGKSILAASGDGVAYVVFGTCISDEKQ
jgi:hypothetical protein